MEERKDEKVVGGDGENKKDHKDKKGGKRYKGKRHKKDPIPDKNDWDWYAPSEQIAKDLASVPFNILPGMPIPVDERVISYNGTSSTTTYTGKQQTIMAIGYVPNNYGTVGSDSSLNLAAKQLYAMIRKKNSGAKTYEPADLMMYILALRDIYTSYFEVKRILKILQYYIFENRAVPAVLAAALGLSDLADATSLVSRYRGQLNLIASKINSFPVPSYFKAFDRGAYVSSQIFADSDSLRAQAYVFTKLLYFVWTGTKYNTGTALEARKWKEKGGTKLDSFITKLNQQINALLLDTDANTIMGDILKAFDIGKLYQVPETTEDEVIQYVMDENVLGQIENMWLATNSIPTLDQFYTSSTTQYNWDVQQNNGLIFGGIVHSTPSDNASLFTDFIQYSATPFNSHKDSPDYKDVLEWSRLIAYVQGRYNKAGNGFDGVNFSCGLEIPLNLYMYSNLNGTVTEQKVKQRNETDPQVLRQVMQYDWHPFIYSVAGGVFNPGADLKVFTLMPTSTGVPINDSAMYAAFFNPKMFSET